MADMEHKEWLENQKNRSDASATPPKDTAGEPDQNEVEKEAWWRKKQKAARAEDAKPKDRQGNPLPFT